MGLGCVVTISNSPAEVGLEGEDKRGEEKGQSTLACVFQISLIYYPTELEDCRGIVFTDGIRISEQASGRKSLSGLYLRNRNV